VSSVSPSSGSTAGGTSVTVNGSNFQSGATVSFGGSALTVGTITASTITGTTTAHAAGAVTVTVTNPGGLNGTCSACFTYGANAIQLENANPGDPTWDDFTVLSGYDVIAGYGSQISVNRGQSIDFFITTQAPSFTIKIYRTGWYGGVGARLMTDLGSFPGVRQTIPSPDPVTGLIECRWPKTTTFTVPSNWTSGVYLAKLTSSTGNKSFIFFVVRNDGGHEDIIFQASVTTYQAYNTWGGVSLYDNFTNKAIYPYSHGTKVSYNRPFVSQDSNGNGLGAGQFLFWDYQALRWLESQSYDVTYITSVDTHTNVNKLTNHKAFISVGHDEYWSRPMRENVQAAISLGVNAAFWSGNTMDWQIRFEPDSLGNANRTQVGYRWDALSSTAPGPDPYLNVNNPLVTTYWRQAPVNQPQNAILGVMYEARVIPDSNYPYVVQNGGHWVYQGTGLVNGQQVPGIVGYEYDRVWNNGLTPAGLTVLSNSPLNGYEGNSFQNASIYTAPGGARVFAAGTISWSWALDDYGSDAGGGNTGLHKPFRSVALSRMMTNLLANMIGP
jgi:hypothetical protein